MFYGNRIRKNFRKGISLIELFQFKIFIFFAHSAYSAVVCSANLNQPDAPFFFKTSAYQI